MAKRKKRNAKEKDNHFLIQLWGVLLILISILGIGKYGPAGRIISSFALFLVGNLYLLLLVAYKHFFPAFFIVFAILN